MKPHYPPSMDRVKEEVELHLKKDNNLANLFEVYKGILAVQLDYLNKIDATVNLSEEEIKECFRNEKFLMSDNKMKIDTKLFRELLSSVCEAVNEKSPEAPASLLVLPEADEFKEENIKKFLQEIALFSKQELEKFIEETEMDKRTGLNSEIISFVILMSLSPFYSSNMKEVREKTDFTLWRQSYCPVCGQTAVIARHRNEDGARILECWLCHAEWVFPRMECPYCSNKDQKKLRFFYVPGDKARQVHVCESCKKYLKTIDNKLMETDVLLDIEAIATGYLDMLAKKEGYILPVETAVLN
ncbi:MAG: formate dehydrogenase accessory protein FdhE [Bacillota bacterium]|nr:formate dehydrogenase accessory protein FdhE [Bacillota bacterium]